MEHGVLICYENKEHIKLLTCPRRIFSRTLRHPLWWFWSYPLETGRWERWLWAPRACDWISATISSGSVWKRGKRTVMVIQKKTKNTNSLSNFIMINYVTKFDQTWQILTGNNWILSRAIIEVIFPKLAQKHVNVSRFWSLAWWLGISVASRHSEGVSGTEVDALNACCIFLIPPTLGT